MIAPLWPWDACLRRHDIAFVIPANAGIFDCTALAMGCLPSQADIGFVTPGNAGIYDCTALAMGCLPSQA
ncbi:MAG: hypothetical protein ONB31_02465 [candidate division KSB1 bacterium]|nr:hypothetical protein [candidate division KSB1 bacterium]MDZ7336501.1 hypothetical protein [candidate division KSB1 bacterium]MDZ7358854.1 hypothetical protein [candidate division KSB1 bacterium]MDZ7399232.1 hypothetical protein [candidate division KSB1 bacterium]